LTNEEARQKAADLMQSRVGLNTYTNGGNRKYFFGKPDNTPGNTTQKGYSDCSSAVRNAIQAAYGIDIGSNTNAQIKNRTKGTIVHETSGYTPDVNLLKVGDCLYFKGNKSHTLDVGHVEMYIGDGKICGHGSGTGPKIRDLASYCKSRASAEKRYFMAIRWIPDDGETAPQAPKNENTLTVAPGSYFLRRGPGTRYVTDGIVVKGGEILEMVNPEGWTPVKYIRDGFEEVRWLGPKGVAGKE
jgi:hypothetical protein